MNNKCLWCNEPVTGRSDKLYCNSSCKSFHHRSNDSIYSDEDLKSDIQSIRTNRLSIEKVHNLYGFKPVTNYQMAKYGFDFFAPMSRFKVCSNEIWNCVGEYCFRYVDDERKRIIIDKKINIITK